ncbi:PLP-dependent transferase [Aspergillus affinis]|uniref:PLP-dependent transferase n=1 Tax=Aspergillus affinis TaxID=1070780 RepID=UPI0022FE484B|nr:PLP-dependent transferase [Aspergillus affinis]KAI9041886.1 PLP-dependent transferase [Aspergillus affinis]
MVHAIEDEKAVLCAAEQKYVGHRTMGGILDSYPEYQSTVVLDKLRETEYSYLDEQDHLYLDYTGAGLAAKAQYHEHEARLTSQLFSNPHSLNPTSEASTQLVERARMRVLEYFNASPEKYTVIFTQNATGAARLVGEAYPFRRNSKFVLTFDNHNSVNGIREFACRNHARTVYVPTQAPDLRVDPTALLSALAGWWPWKRDTTKNSHRKRGLFAYPAQSNFSGVRHPLEWVDLAQKCGYDVLLDAAAYLPTKKLQLSDGNPQPEFLMVSWYKLFGYPTGVGCLIARRDAIARLSRPWFSGGTVSAVTVGIPWHTMAQDEAAFEDGTPNFLSIPDVHFGLDWLTRVDVAVIETRVRCLTGWFLDRLKCLRHTNGAQMIEIYGPQDNRSRGSTVAFNFIDVTGKVVDERLVASESAAARISLRTGCFCNPGGGETAFGLGMQALRPLYRISKTISVDDYVRLVGLSSAGAIRVSFGLASTTTDVDRFMYWAEHTYRDRETPTAGFPPRGHC